MTSVTRSSGERDHSNRAVRRLRVATARATAGPAVALAYALGTFGAAGRPTMVAIIVATLVLLGLVWAGARPIVASPHVFAIQAAASATVVASMTGLLLLDGGVASPIGALSVYALLLFGATVPTRIFVVVSVLSAVSYAGVAVLGDRPPPGTRPR